MSDQDVEVNPLIEQQQRRAAEIGVTGADPAAGPQASPVIDWGEPVTPVVDADAEAQRAATQAPETEVAVEDQCGATIPIQSTGEAVSCTMPAGHDGDHYNHDVDAEWVDGDETLVDADEPEPVTQGESPGDTQGESEVTIVQPGVGSVAAGESFSATIRTSEGTAPLGSEAGAELVRGVLRGKAEAGGGGALFDVSEYDQPELRLRTRDDQLVSLIRVAFTGGEDLQRLDPEHVSWMREAGVGQPVELTITGHVAGVTEAEKGSEGQIQMVVKVAVGRVTSGL